MQNYKLHLSESNSKLGNVLSFNTLPTSTAIYKKDGTVLCETRGTCAGVCGSCQNVCYALNAVKRYPTARNAWAENTEYLRNDWRGLLEDLRDGIRAYVKKCRKNGTFPVVRIHSSGEFMLASEMANAPEFGELEIWYSIARQFPYVRFYAYTKRWELVKEYEFVKTVRTEKYTDTEWERPENLVLLESCGFEDESIETIEEKAKTRHIFLYDDCTRVEFRQFVHCPAVDSYGHKTGVTCDKCGRCYNKQNGVTAVYAH